MSAFTVIYERFNSPVEPGMLNRVMERLKHRGPDGCDILFDGNVALGHWHFWTTPEEVGETQPLALKGMPFKIVLDGRLDNRSDLLAELNLNPIDPNRFSDAALMLHAYAYWGEHCFEHFIGEYAVVIFDEQSRVMACARDALGDRTLFYALDGTRLVIASEPWAVAGASGSSTEIDESVVADYFALKFAPEDGRTLFKHVFELLPAHVMVVNSTGQRTRRYWIPDFSSKLRGLSDEEYAEQFLSLLEEGVRCRLRSTTPAAVLMSGGLDSTSVACLAARITSPQPLTTVSYVFNELVNCDERQYIKTVEADWGIRSIQIPCDDAWPYKDWQNWPRDPNQPEGNPYRLLKERAYSRAHDAGVKVLLTGGFGDHLYLAGRNWLTDLVMAGRLWDAVRELSFQIRKKGWRKALAASHPEHLARRLLNAVPGGSRVHRSQTTPVWLTTFSAGIMSKVLNEPDHDFEKHGTLLGLVASYSCSREIANSSRHNLELRHPYRDRRLIEFVLSLPAHQLYNNGVNKHILRTSMRGILPEAIRTRLQPTSLLPLFYRGVEREKKSLSTRVQEKEAVWGKYVRADWLQKRRNATGASQKDRAEIVSWLCITYETWYETLISLN